MRGARWAGLVLVFCGAGAVAAPAAGGPERPSERALGSQIAAQADQLRGLRSLRAAGASTDDCSGLVILAYRRAGHPLGELPGRPGEGGVARLSRLARGAVRRSRAPVRGDLVFFRDTLRTPAPRQLTHVGIVDGVDSDGVITFVHRAGAGVVVSKLDPRRPAVYRDASGRLHNDYLRRAGPGRPARLTGQLLVGFAPAERLLRASQANLARTRPRHRDPRAKRRL